MRQTPRSFPLEHVFGNAAGEQAASDWFAELGADFFPAQVGRF